MSMMAMGEHTIGIKLREDIKKCITPENRFKKEFLLCEQYPEKSVRHCSHKKIFYSKNLVFNYYGRINFST